jgi:hypothetical protein
VNTNAFGKLLRDCRESRSGRLVINGKKPSPTLVGDLRVLLVTLIVPFGFQRAGWFRCC